MKQREGKEEQGTKRILCCVFSLLFASIKRKGKKHEGTHGLIERNKRGKGGSFFPFQLNHALLCHLCLIEKRQNKNHNNVHFIHSSIFLYFVLFTNVMREIGQNKVKMGPKEQSEKREACFHFVTLPSLLSLWAFGEKREWNVGREVSSGDESVSLDRTVSDGIKVGFVPYFLLLN